MSLNLRLVLSNTLAYLVFKLGAIFTKILRNFLENSDELLTNFLRTSYELLTNFLQIRMIYLQTLRTTEIHFIFLQLLTTFLKTS